MKSRIAIVLSVICVVTSSMLYMDSLKGNEIRNAVEVEETITYPLMTVVTAIDKDNDEVFVEDCNGNIWSFYGVEDWFVEDICILTMEHKANADDIYGDIIIDTTYGGDAEWVLQATENI